MRGYLSRVLAAGLLSILCLAALPAQACFACSCSPPETPDLALSRSAAVFRGRVTAVSEWRSNGFFGTPYRQVIFQVDTVWKGPGAAEIVVNTRMGGADCGYRFAPGQVYLVYAYQDRGQSFLPAGLSTGLCARTRAISQASADLNALGVGTAVASPAPTAQGGRTGLVLSAIGLFAGATALAGALLTWRLRQARQRGSARGG